MLPKILLVITIALVLLTFVTVYRGGRIDDGTFANWTQCDGDREYYNLHERECDNLFFYIPLFFSPVWLALIIAWIIVQRRFRAEKTKLEPTG